MGSTSSELAIDHLLFPWYFAPLQGILAERGGKTGVEVSVMQLFSAIHPRTRIWELEMGRKGVRGCERWSRYWTDVSGQLQCELGPVAVAHELLRDARDAEKLDVVVALRRLQ